MKINRGKLLSLGLVIGAFLVTAILYPHLPDRVPTHWGLNGRPDQYTGKPWGPFVLPLVMAGLYLVLSLLPAISPRGFRMEQFKRTFEVIRATILGFLFLIMVMADLAALGKIVSVDRFILAAVGLLFLVLGNYMGKVTKNFFVGIRTPWTLASDEVWLRTHRFGGKLFVLAGLVVIVCAIAGLGLIPGIVAIGVASLVPVIYSYVIYRRIEGFKNHPPDDGSPDDAAPGHFAGKSR